MKFSLGHYGLQLNLDQKQNSLLTHSLDPLECLKILATLLCMDNVDPFDKKLDIRGPYIPNEVKDSAIWVNDTLDLCWASAKSVFGEQATPEVAIAILDKVMAKIAMDRQAEAVRHRQHHHDDDDYDDYSDEF